MIEEPADRGRAGTGRRRLAVRGAARALLLFGALALCDVAAATTLTRSATRTATPTRTPLPVSCPGDCDGDSKVEIPELITGINMALGGAQPGGCESFDTTNDRQVDLHELVAAVHAALNGCAVDLVPVSAGFTRCTSPQCYAPPTPKAVAAALPCFSTQISMKCIGTPSSDESNNELSFAVPFPTAWSRSRWSRAPARHRHARPVPGPRRDPTPWRSTT